MRDLINYAEQYEKHTYEKFQVYFRKKKIKEILANNNHEILLEIGCGFESIFKDIESYRKLYIVEPTQLFYNKTVSDCIESKRRNDIVVINKILEDCETEFDEISFDFVLLSGLLHEIIEPQNLLQFLHRKVSDNTIIHINVPNAKSFHRLLAVEMGLIANEFQKSDSDTKFQRHSVFDLHSLTNLVEQKGFKIIDKGSYSFKPFTHLQMEKMISAKLITEDVLEGFYKLEKYFPEFGSEIFVNIKKI